MSELAPRRPLGLSDASTDLAEWTDRLAERRIAVAARVNGGPVLVRPDSVFARITADVPLERAVEAGRGAGLRLVLRSDGEPRSVGPYVRFSLDPDLRGRRWSVEPVGRCIDELGARGLKFRPNYVYLANVRATSHPSLAANAGSARGVRRTSARPAARVHVPEPLHIPGRAAPRILILDTGLRTTTIESRRVPQHESLRSAARIHDAWRTEADLNAADDDDEASADADGSIDVCAGHGTFIAGVVHRICPDAEIHVDGVLSSFGDGDDDTIEAGILRASRRLAPDHFDLVILSLGATTADDRYPPLATAVRELATNGRTVVVASAGNDASTQPSWPAAMPEVVGVGALDGAGRAWFSNYGGWVDACAPGVDIVSTFFCDAEDRDGDRVTRFDGWASWNGTSFAAPIVAATIAQDMYLHGDAAPDAWRRLSDWRRPRVPDLGVVFPG